MEQQLFIKYQYNYIFRHREVIITLTWEKQIPVMIQ